MPKKAKLAQVIFGGELLFIILFAISFLIGIKFVDAISLNTVDDYSQWVSSNDGVLAVSQDTGIKQEGTGSVKMVATQGESSWYDSSYGNRKPITITYSGSELTSEDILVEIDTASLVSASKLQSDCDDLRFTDSDGETAISYWIESGCNTSTTQVWVQVPSIPDGGKDIYIYYNNSGATNGEASWSGSFTLLGDASCPSGWSRNLDLDAAFPRGASSYGATGGNANSTHSNTTGSTESKGTGSVKQGSRGSAKAHTHSVNIPISAKSALPPYLDMVYCSSSDLTVGAGQIALFDASAPSGWTRFSALDGVFPRGAASYGGTGGSSAHTHSTSSSTSGGPSSTAGCTGGSYDKTTSNHNHSISSTTTGSGSSIPPYLDMVFAERDAQGSFPAGGILITSALPPLGWTRFTALDGLLPQGAASYGGTGGASTHTHSFSIGASASSANNGGCSSGTPNIGLSPYNHGHNSKAYNTPSGSNLPPYVDVIYAERNTSAVSTAVGSEQQNGANNHTTTDTIDASNYSGYKDVSFYVRSDRTGSYTRFEMGESSSSEQTYAINIASADTWELKTWDISGISSTAIDAITKMAFRVTDASTGFTMYFDNVRANSAPSTPTASSPADDSWISSREFCATTTDADSDNYNATFVIDGVGSYDGEVVASGNASCYTHTTDLSSVSWYANASDTNSYTSGNTSSYTAKIDSVAPSNLSASSSSNDWVTDQPTITVSTPTDATSGINEIRYSYANDLGADCSAGTITSAGADLTGTLTQGSHILYLCASDNAGGVTTWNGAYKWDNGNPIVNITSHIATTYNASNIPSTISGTASDVAGSIAGVTVAITDGVNYWSGAAWDSIARVWIDATAGVNWSLNLTPDKDGDFTVESQATDTAGNTSSIDSVSFSYDSVAPGISTAPTVSSITNTGAVIGWSTDEASSTRVQYGPYSGYGKLTTIADLSPRVTDHEETLSSLKGCTTYHYRVLGTDAAGNQVTGTDRTFTTTGCVGSATIEKESRSNVTTADGGTVNLTDGDDQVSLTVPPSFGADDATFQMKKLGRTQVLAAISTPTADLNAVGDHVYQFDALSDAETTVTSFDEAITITMNYTDEEISTLDESSLLIYRWDGSAWHALTDCVVDAEANTVTCSTTAFSTFILFGEEPASSGGSSSEPGPDACSGPPPGLKVPNIYAAIPQSATSIKLYFTDADNPIQKYVLNFGQQSGVYTYGADDIGERGNGWKQYVVEGLEPGTEYFFKVRGEHKCQPGGWSNEFSAATPVTYSTSETDSFVQSVEISPLVDELAPICAPHTVKAGEGLWQIAQEIYGDGYQYLKLIKDNAEQYPSLETTPSYLEEGWQLKTDNCSETISGFDGIRIRLVDNRGKAIGNVPVTFAGQEGILNEEGYVDLEAVDPGDYLVSIYNDEGVVAQRSVQIDEVTSGFEILIRVQNRVPWDGLPWYLLVFEAVKAAWLELIPSRN